MKHCPTHHWIAVAPTAPCAMCSAAEAIRALEVPLEALATSPDAAEER